MDVIILGSDLIDLFISDYCPIDFACPISFLYLFSYIFLIYIADVGNLNQQKLNKQVPFYRTSISFGSTFFNQNIRAINFKKSETGF